MSQPTRSLWGQVLKNFINSLKPRRFSGDLKGVDYNGTKYYEIPANACSGKQRASRWFEPKTAEDFQQDLPAEWESWLRGRRKNPPTEEEIAKNLAIMEMKRKKAVEIDAKGGKATPMVKGMESFPKRPEYELAPGEKRDRKD